MNQDDFSSRVSGRLKKAFFSFLILLLNDIIPFVVILSTLYLVIYLMSWLIAPSIWYKFWFKSLQVVVVITIAVMFFINVKFLWRIIKQLRFFGMYKFPPGSFKPEDWKERIKTAGTYAQDALLYRTDHNVLSLKPEQFLEVLKEIRPLIKAEPALSTYWDQRDQLEQVLKQERQG